MADSRLYVHVLLDRSGSMESCRDSTIDAFNSYVDLLAGQSRSGTRLSLTTFDSESFDTIVEAARIADVPRLTRDTFVPRACTPLFDAVAHVVGRIDATNLLAEERVALTILTDGQENASREMTADAVRKMLGDRQERLNWLVQYLGANQDAWSAAASIGVAGAHAMDFSTGAVAGTMSSAASSMGRYRRAAPDAARSEAAFTPAERSAARGKP